MIYILFLHEYVVKSEGLYVQYITYEYGNKSFTEML